MRAIGAFTALAFAALIGTSASAGEVLHDPDPSTVFLLQYKMAKAEPPYAAMVPSMDTVKAANEFQRAAVAERANASLRARAASLANVGEITVRLGSRFSEYDADSGEYDLDLNDGTYIPLSAFGHQVRLSLTNGTEAQAWKLSPTDAATALRKNRGDRSAALLLTLALLDSPPAVDGEPLVLNAKIVRYNVVTTFGNVRLGGMVVADTP